ncbi:hypothetical protein M0802_006000 [Mischocyttarus mexicanus]|nr:hypothetical protein M0802_006000 [Mischocyttarus mexicanus]
MSTPISDKQNLQISSKRINALIKTEDVFVSYQNDPKPGKRKTLSKLSIVPNGSRFLFHYRGDRLKIPKYQNTYRLEPFRFFHVETVDDIVRNILENKLSSVLIYHPDNASKLSMEIANDVLRAINRREYDRCKVVVQVTIVQRIRQSVHSAFQCLWDAERDNYSYHVFENSHIYAWCCVFGLYYE